MEKGLLTTNYGTVADWDTVKFIYIEAFPIDKRLTTVLNQLVKGKYLCAYF
jgi:hypothetical protein